MLHLAVAINDKDRDLIPIFVSIFTLSKSYHTELVFTDGTALICDPTGVRFGTRTYDRYHWVIIPLPWITRSQEREIRAHAEEIVLSKPKYDWLGAIFGGLTSWFDNPHKWFCSELCCYVLRDFTPALQEDAESIHRYGKIWWTPELLWRTLSEYLDDHYPKYSEGWKFRYRNNTIKATDGYSAISDADKLGSKSTE